GEDRLHLVAHFLKRRPNLFEIDVLTGFAFANRFAGQVNIHAASQGKRHDERWGHEEIGFDTLMYACFEITVAREHRSSDQVMLRDRFIDRRRQWSRVADT